MSKLRDIVLFIFKLYNVLVSSLKKIQVRDITSVNLKLQCLLDVTDIEDDLSNEAKV